MGRAFCICTTGVTGSVRLPVTVQQRPKKLCLAFSEKGLSLSTVVPLVGWDVPNITDGRPRRPDSTDPTGPTVSSIGFGSAKTHEDGSTYVGQWLQVALGFRV